MYEHQANGLEQQRERNSNLALNVNVTNTNLHHLEIFIDGGLGVNDIIDASCKLLNFVTQGNAHLVYVWWILPQPHSCQVLPTKGWMVVCHCTLTSFSRTLLSNKQLIQYFLFALLQGMCVNGKVCTKCRACNQ